VFVFKNYNCGKNRQIKISIISVKKIRCAKNRCIFYPLMLVKFENIVIFCAIWSARGYISGFLGWIRQPPGDSGRRIRDTSNAQSGCNFRVGAVSSGAGLHGE